MPHANALAGKELVINNTKFFVGLFKWPDEDDPESCFAALLQGGSNDTWTTISRLPPMPLANPAKGAMATMADILVVFNELISPDAEMTWLDRMKKLFDNLSVENGKIVSAPL